jgi:hypothetical protein
MYQFVCVCYIGHEHICMCKNYRVHIIHAAVHYYSLEEEELEEK